MKKVLFLLLVQIIIIQYGHTQTKPIIWIYASQVSDTTVELKNKGTIADSLYTNNLTHNAKRGEINTHTSQSHISTTIEKSRISGDNLLKPTQYTIITAYHTKEQDTLIGLWTIKRDTNHILSLNSRQLIIGKSKIQYIDSNYTEPVVNTVVQDLKRTLKDTQGADTLYIGHTEDNKLQGQFAELIIFEGNMTDKERKKWQSALSLKYSSTMQKSNYYTAVGDTLWHYTQDSLYSRHIGGIGKDTIRGLDQSESRIYQDALSIKLNNINYPNQDEYIIWGHNGKPLDIESFQYKDTTKYAILSRTWKLREHYKDSINPIQAEIKYKYQSDINPEHIVLLQSTTISQSIDITTTTLHYPDSITPEYAIYKNINLRGQDKAPIQLGIAYNTDAQEQTKITTNTDSPETNTEFTLYPNPSTGNYTIESNLRESSPLHIRITNIKGEQIQQYNIESKKQHRITGEIKENGSYIITIEYNGGKQTKKLIISK